VNDNIETIKDDLTSNSVNTVGGGSVYYSDTTILPNSTYSLPNGILLTNAFNGTRDTSGATVKASGTYKTYIFAIDGNNDSYYTSKQPMYLKMIDSGTSELRDFPCTVDSITDADPTKTPWVLALNYLHKEGTNPDGNIRTSDYGTSGLPIVDNEFDDVDLTQTLVIDETGSTDWEGSWGHTGNELFNKVCEALGSPDNANYNDNGLEIRFLAKAGNHTRLIHFKTTDPGWIQDFRKGDKALTSVAADVTAFLNKSTVYDSESGIAPEHTALLPLNLLTIYGGNGDVAMNGGIMYKNGNSSWSCGGNSWQVDDYYYSAVPFYYNTYHQIWVRPNKEVIIYENVLSLKVATPTDSGININGSTIQSATSISTTHYYVLTFDTSSSNPTNDDVISFVTTNIKTIKASLTPNAINSVG
jgi:hypothetical protein